MRQRASPVLSRLLWPCIIAHCRPLCISDAQSEARPRKYAFLRQCPLSTMGCRRPALRAGVSSFGVGGTNAHVVLEESPASALPEGGRSCHLIVLSARTPAALDQQRQRLAAHLANKPGLDLADAAFTLQTSRRAFEHRHAFTCRTMMPRSRLYPARRRRRSPRPHSKA